MKKLAIIGASYLQLPAYLKANEIGVETIGFAWDEGAVAKNYSSRFYSISTLDRERILNVCQDEKIDGVLTIATDIAVPTVSYIAEAMGLIGNSASSAHVSTNKFLMRQAFERKGLTCPKYFRLLETTNLDTYKSSLEYPLIVKPVDRSGSRGITKVNSFTKLKKATTIALSESFCQQVIVERFIEGTEVSVESISFEGKHFPLTITDKVTSGYPHYVELEHHQPSLLPAEKKKFIYSETVKALDALNIKYGASHTEFIISGDGVFITELGARMGGDFIGSNLVLLSTGYDFLKGVIELSLNKFEEPAKMMKKFAGIYFLSTETKHLKAIIERPENYEGIVSAELTDQHLKEGQL